MLTYQSFKEYFRKQGIDYREIYPDSADLKKMCIRDSPYVREHLGLGINNGTLFSKVEVSEVVKGLIKVVTDILNPEFKVSELSLIHISSSTLFISLIILALLTKVSLTSGFTMRSTYL